MWIISDSLCGSGSHRDWRAVRDWQHSTSGFFTATIATAQISNSFRCRLTNVWILKAKWVPIITRKWIGAKWVRIFCHPAEVGGDQILTPVLLLAQFDLKPHMLLKCEREFIRGSIVPSHSEHRRGCSAVVFEVCVATSYFLAVHRSFYPPPHNNVSIGICFLLFIYLFIYYSMIATEDGNTRLQ